MRRSVIVFAVMLIMAVAFGLYRMEYLIRDMEQRLAQVNRDVLQSDQAIQVLEAEWSYLNQPRRLQLLTENHLQLVPLLPSQIGLIGDLPMKDPKVNFTGVLDIQPDNIRPVTEATQPTGRRLKAKVQRTSGKS